MTPERVYCGPYYRSNVKRSLAEEDSAQAGFARISPMAPEWAASGKIVPAPPLDLDLESDMESELGKPKKRMEGEGGVLLDLDFEDPFADFFAPEMPKKDKAGNLDFEVFPIAVDGAWYVCMYVCMYVWTDACVHVCMHACLYVCLYLSK